LIALIAAAPAMMDEMVVSVKNTKRVFFRGKASDMVCKVGGGDGRTMLYIKQPQ